MPNFRVLSLITLIIAVGCSSVPKTERVSVHAERFLNRKMASVDDRLSSPRKLKNKINALMDGVVHGYMIGQVYLEEFDKELDASSDNVLESDAYLSLQAVRAHVDHYEDELNDLYLDLVMIDALPEFPEEQKKLAQETLTTIDKFVEGSLNDDGRLPENLKPLVLGNLKSKQVEVNDELELLHNDQRITKNNRSIKNKIKNKQLSLSKAKKYSNKELQEYHVDKKVLKNTLDEEKKKESFKRISLSIKSLAKNIKAFSKKIVGRETSSQVIFPSTGSSGNISGNTFPENTWSLTYDDGPGEPTSQIVANLLERDIPATFFMLARQVERNPNTTKLIVDGGFDLASHSYTHPDLTKVNSAQLEREIGTSKNVLESIVGKKIQLFRLPYGAGTGNSAIRSKIIEHNLIHVFWNVDTLDWQEKNPHLIYDRTIKQMNRARNKGGIILFHDIHTQTSTASTMLMDYLNSNNLTACTVQGVVDQLNKNLSSCK